MYFGSLIQEVRLTAKVLWLYLETIDVTGAETKKQEYAALFSKEVEETSHSINLHLSA